MNRAGDAHLISDFVRLTSTDLRVIKSFTGNRSNAQHIFLISALLPFSSKGHKRIKPEILGVGAVSE